MRRFKVDQLYTGLDLFYELFGTDYLYNVYSYRIYHDSRDRLQRLLANNKCNIQDYIYIQHHGVFSSPEKVGDWLETFLHEYGEEIRDILFRTCLEVSTVKGYQLFIMPMKLDRGDVGPNCYHYDGLKFETLPPPGCPIFTHNGSIIGHMPEDEPMKA